MRRLTKKKTLTVNAELWKWLAETGKDLGGKLNWEGWKKYGRMNNDCPCCQYESDNGGTAKLVKTGTDCETRCLLKSIWKNGCQSKPSPYYNWENACTIKARKKYARQIYRACMRELRKLK